jgi:hypothetical protein
VAQKEKDEDGYSNYAIQHPVRSKYENLLSSLADATASRYGMKQNMGLPGDGRLSFADANDALRDAAVIEAEITAGYFSAEDFARVFPGYEPSTVWVDLPQEKLDFMTLSTRQALIKQICEENDWFEAEDVHRIRADEF